MRHTRKDFQYSIIKGQPHFTRAAYACIITQEDRFGRRCIYHVETFFGDHGVKVRAAAMRFGRAICHGQNINKFREEYLSTIFPAKGLPPRPDQLSIPA